MEVVRIYHDKFDKYNNIPTHNGITYVLCCHDGRYYIGIAYCRKCDQYNKKIGVSTAKAHVDLLIERGVSILASHNNKQIMAAEIDMNILIKLMFIKSLFKYTDINIENVSIDFYHIDANDFEFLISEYIYTIAEETGLTFI